MVIGAASDDGAAIDSPSVRHSGAGVGGAADRVADAQIRHCAALGVSVGRLAELGVEIESALDRQAVVGLGGLDDITDVSVRAIIRRFAPECVAA